jgi:hypothetical protein
MSMQTAPIPHGGASNHWRTVLLAVAVTAVAVVAGVSLADLQAPAGAVLSSGAPARDDALAAAARGRHAPLAETAPSPAPTGSAATPGGAEPLIQSAE